MFENLRHFLICLYLGHETYSLGKEGYVVSGELTVTLCPALRRAIPALRPAIPAPAIMTSMILVNRRSCCSNEFPDFSSFIYHENDSRLQVSCSQYS